jgi:hypothetical protein
LEDCEFHAIVDCPLNQTCRDTDTAWANARLIAAAPELLAVLEEIVKAIDFERGASETEDAERLLIAARAAIAKATGEA